MFLNVKNKINNNVLENENNNASNQSDSEDNDSDEGKIEQKEIIENNIITNNSIISSTIKERNSISSSNKNLLFISEFDFNKSLETVLKYIESNNSSSSDSSNRDFGHLEKRIKLLSNDGTSKVSTTTTTSNFKNKNYEHIFNSSLQIVGNYIIKNQLNSNQISLLLKIILKIDRIKGYSLLKRAKPKEVIFDQDLKILISSLNSNNSTSKVYPYKLGRWLVSNINYLNHQILHSHYQLFFNFLNDIQLGRVFVDILVKITKKSDVKIFRSKWLMSVSNISKFNYILPLLKVYHKFDPINIVLKQQQQQQQPSTSTKQSQQYSTNNNDNNNTINYTNIKNNINQIKINIENIILPNKISDVLENENSTHLLALSNCYDPSIIRFKNWISDILQDLTFSKSSKDIKSKNETEKLLSSLVKFLDYFQEETIQDLDLYLINFLRIWDGQSYQNQIFKLLSRINIYSFEYLYSNYLKPLHKLFSVMDLNFKIETFKCFTNLLDYWISTDWVDLWNRNQFRKPIFTKISSNVEYYSSIIEFSKYFDQFSIIALIQTNDHPIIQHYILEFYTVTSLMVKKFNLAFTITPSIHLFRRLYLSNHSISISRLGTILTNYALEFHQLKINIQQNNNNTFKIKELNFTTLPNFNNNIQIINNCYLELINNLFSTKSNPSQQQQQKIKSNNNEKDNSNSSNSNNNNSKLNLSLSIYSSIIFFNYYNIYKQNNNNNNNQNNYLIFLKNIGLIGLYNLLINHNKS